MEIQEKTIFETARGSSSQESTVLATQLTPTCTSNEQMIITKLRTFLCEQILFLPCDIIQTGCFFFGGKKVADFSEQCTRCVLSIIGASYLKP